LAKIKFIQFYNTLGKKEIKDFKKFADANYFNKGRDFKKILSIIHKINHKNLNSGDFISLLSEELKISSRTIWNRLHELMNIAEKYIAIKEAEGETTRFDNITGRYYLNKASYNLFEQKYKANLKAYSKSKKGIETFYHFYEVLQSGGYYYIYSNQNEKYIKNLSDQVIYHSASFMINHYLHLTELLQLQNLTAKELSSIGLSFLTDDNVENFLTTLMKDHDELYHIVFFHYYIYKAFLNKKEDIFYTRAKDSFRKVYKILHNNYKTMLYQILINYCIERTNMNDREYYGELFELYNRKLEDGLFQDLQVGNFPINNFRDYVFVALQLGKIDWIRGFIEKYSPELPENIRKDEINLSYGIVYYHESDNKKALECRELYSLHGEILQKRCSTNRQWKTITKRPRRTKNSEIKDRTN
jgi:hypothetical protein